MSLRYPLWTVHFEDAELRVVETHGKTIRVMVAGGHVEVSRELALRLGRELVDIVLGPDDPCSGRFRPSHADE